MAKNSKTLNRFDAGTVEGPNPRDISDEASVAIEGLDPTLIGGLNPAGTYSEAENPAFTGLSQALYGRLLNQIPQNNTNQGYNYGLYQFSSAFPNLWKMPGCQPIDGLGQLGENLTDYDKYTSSGVTEDVSSDIIYTILVTSLGNGGMLSNSDNAVGYGFGILDNTTPFPVPYWYGGGVNGFGLLLHAYSVDDNGATVNQWHLLRRDVALGAISRSIEPGQLATLGFNTGPDVSNGLGYKLITADFSEHNPTPAAGGEYEIHSLSANPDDPTDYSSTIVGHPRGLNWGDNYNSREFYKQYMPINTESMTFPSKPYLPKFYTIGDTIRMYDENLEGATYFIGFCKYGYRSNIEQSGDDATSPGIAGINLQQDSQQDDVWKVNQWVVQPNLIRQPYGTKTLVSHPDTEGDTNHGFPGEESPWPADWHLQEIEGTQTYANQNVDFHGDSWTPSNLATGLGGFHMRMEFTAQADGGWIDSGGQIKFWATKLYDGDTLGTDQTPGQESNPVGNTIDPIRCPGGSRKQGNQTLRIDVATPSWNNVNVTIGTTEGASRYYQGPRCTGYRLYYSYTGEGAEASEVGGEDFSLYLLATVDWDKGYMIAGTKQWNTLGAGNRFSHVFVEPPQFEDFISLNNYVPGTGLTAKFKTAVYHKQRCFAGNVLKNGKRYPHRVIKSPVGMPDIFPDENFLDVGGTKGGDVVHLEGLSEELLVFKERALYVLDISEMDNEKVKSVHDFMGISNHNHVCSTRHGLIFANAGGVWHYKQGTEDNQIINLLFEESVAKISGETWRKETDWDENILDSGKVQLAYDQENDKLIINVSAIPGSDTAGDAFIYHFPSTAWYVARGCFPQANPGADYCSNLITDYNGRILFAAQDNATAQVAQTFAENGGEHQAPWPQGDHLNETLHNVTNQATTSMRLYQYKEPTEDDTNTIATGKLNWISKDFTFDSIGSKKSLYKVYLTYKTAGTGASNLVVTYRVDGGSTDYEFSNDSTFNDKTSSTANAYNKTTGLVNTESVFRTAELIPDVRSQSRKLNSIQLRVHNPGGTVSKNQLNLDDFTIIYKEHPKK